MSDVESRLNEFMFLVFFFTVRDSQDVGPNLPLGGYFFTRPAYLLDRVFPKEKPKSKPILFKSHGRGGSLYFVLLCKKTDLSHPRLG
ncbi:MAG: hypothetical protein IPF71_13460 [Rhodoferax sp.]|nr:hypothetical protein [Rhodoferax sp.]